MLTSLLAEALAVTFDNLTMTANLLECAEEAAEDMNPDLKQKLGLVHMGLEMALQGMEFDELQEFTQQADIYCDC